MDGLCSDRSVSCQHLFLSGHFLGPLLHQFPNFLSLFAVSNMKLFLVILQSSWLSLVLIYICVFQVVIVTVRSVNMTNKRCGQSHRTNTVMEPRCSALTTLDIYYFGFLQIIRAVDADMSSCRHKHTEVTKVVWRLVRRPNHNASEDTILASQFHHEGSICTQTAVHMLCF